MDAAFIPTGRARAFLREVNRDVFTPRNLMTVGEMSSTTLENCQQYAALNGNELSMTFNFHHLKVDYPGGEKWTLAKPDYAPPGAIPMTCWPFWPVNPATTAASRCSGITVKTLVSPKANRG